MSTQAKMWIAGITLAVGIGLGGLSGASETAGEKDLRPTVAKIADALKKGDKVGAKKLAAAAVMDQELAGKLENIMHMFRPRAKKGMGFGPKPILIEEKDGIDLGLRFIKAEGADDLVKHSGDIETTGYWIAAIAELSNAKGWDDVMDKRTKAGWKKLTDEMGGLGIAFAEAGASKNAVKIRAAAIKTYDCCSRCHDIYRD